MKASGNKYYETELNISSPLLMPNGNKVIAQKEG